MKMKMREPGTFLGGMVGVGLREDEVLDGLRSDEVLEILSILDLPMDSLEDGDFVGDWDSNFGPIPLEMLMWPPVIDQGKAHTRPPRSLHRPVSVINETPKQNPLPSYVEEVRRHNKFPEVQESGLFQTKSPVSVLESSGSSSAGKSLPVKSNNAFPVRSRSKRERLSGESPWLYLMPFPAPKDPLKIKRRRKTPVPNYQDAALEHNRPGLTKKCSHCEITKTPQWRGGPMGPQTLCNACGVRYRSGRLFPEYRPAASPSFIPSLHSNSHRKVAEMRNKAKLSLHEVRVEELVPLSSPQLEFVPMSSYLFDYV